MESGSVFFILLSNVLPVLLLDRKSVVRSVLSDSVYVFMFDGDRLQICNFLE